MNDPVSDCARALRKSRGHRLAPTALVLLTAALGLSVALLLVRGYSIREGDRRFGAAVAAAGRLDPRWRWDDILADRAAVPDEQNGAHCVAAAFWLLPYQLEWDPRRACVCAAAAEDGGARPEGGCTAGPEQPTLLEEIVARPPAEPLADDILTDLRAELDNVQAALREARALADRPTGRHPVSWQANYRATPLPHHAQARSVARLLQLDAVLAAEDGQIEHALRYCRAAVNAGRSIGDEPTLASVGVRLDCTRSTVRAVERVLAQGTASPEALAALARLLDDEAAQPLLWAGLRGERAAWAEVLGRIHAGEMSFRAVRAGAADGPIDWLDRLRDWSYGRPLARVNQAAFLELMRRAVEAADQPAARQREAFQALEAEVRALNAGSPRLVMATFIFPALAEARGAICAASADLHSARLALAAERFRLAHARWPAAAERLVPEFLGAVPDDPFADGPLRCRRVDDGLIVDSVGPDGANDGGPVVASANRPRPPGQGFRLWDGAKRRHAPRPQSPDEVFQAADRHIPAVP